MLLYGPRARPDMDDPPLRYSSRFWLYAPTCVFLLLAAAVVLLWWSATAAFRAELAALKGHKTESGVTLNWTGVTVSGFPFRIDAAFRNFSARGLAAHGPFVWTSPALSLHTLTYGRRKTVYEAAGQQHLEWVDGSGHPRRADFLPGTMRGSSTTDSRGLARLDVDIVDADGGAVTARRVQFHMRRDPDGKDLDVALRGDDVKGLGAPAALVEGYFTLTGSAPLMPLLAGKTGWPQAVQQWRQQGGAPRLTKGVLPAMAKSALSGLF